MGKHLLTVRQLIWMTTGMWTHVAGTIAALDNEIGVVGVAPESDLYAIKVLNQFGDGNHSDIVAGIEWAISHDIDILNMSLGGTTRSNTFKKAVDSAYKNGMLLVAAGGNYGYDRKERLRI